MAIRHNMVLGFASCAVFAGGGRLAGAHALEVLKPSA